MDNTQGKQIDEMNVNVSEYNKNLSEEMQQRMVTFLSQNETILQTETLLVEGLSLLGAWDISSFFDELQLLAQQKEHVWPLARELRGKKEKFIHHYLQMKGKGFLHFPCYTCKNAMNCPFGMERIIFVDYYLNLFTKLIPFLDQLQEGIVAYEKTGNPDYVTALAPGVSDFQIYFKEIYTKWMNSVQSFIKISKQRNKEKIEGKKFPPYVIDEVKSLPALPL